jgi:hypothetical protein
MVVEVHQDLADIPEVVLADTEDLEDMVVVAVEEMQEMTEVVEEKSTETVAAEIAMVDVADGNRCKT